MRDIPIMFAGDMVRSILAGAKTQTRRVVKENLVPFIEPRKDDPNHAAFIHSKKCDGWACDHKCGGIEVSADNTVSVSPYGTTGDRLWVRETWRAVERERDSVDGILYAADDWFRPIENTARAAELWVEAYDNGKHGLSWRPSIFMRRWMSRLDLENLGVRIERLHAITEEDAKAEGAAWRIAPGGDLAGAFEGINCDIGYRNHFGDLWKRINGAESWGENPWVWCIKFPRYETAQARAA